MIVFLFFDLKCHSVFSRFLHFIERSKDILLCFFLPGGAEPLSNDAAVVGTDIRGDNMRGAPKGAEGFLREFANPGIPGDKSL